MSIQSVVPQNTVSQFWSDIKPKPREEVVDIAKLKDAVIHQITDIARLAKTHAKNVEEPSAKEFLDAIAHESNGLVQKYDAPAPLLNNSIRPR